MIWHIATYHVCKIATSHGVSAPQVLRGDVCKIATSHGVSAPQVLGVSVWDKDLLASDDLIGELVVNLADIPPLLPPEQAPTSSKWSRATPAGAERQMVPSLSPSLSLYSTEPLLWGVSRSPPPLLFPLLLSQVPAARQARQGGGAAALGVGACGWGEEGGRRRVEGRRCPGRSGC